MSGRPPPELWNRVRRAVDASDQPGRFILTGSAIPADDVTRHTGAGRFLRLRQRTMSWWEKQDPPSPGVSLARLLDGDAPQPVVSSESDLETVITNLLRPGFPAMTSPTPDQSAARLRGYVDDVACTDVPRLANVRHEPEVIRQLLVALARSTASEVAYSTLAKDVRVVAPAITEETVAEYVRLQQRLFIVETQKAWTPELRSRARVRTSPKFHLADPALAAAVLGVGASQLRTDLPTVGMLFESAVFHDLSVFISAIGGEVRHYRDSNGYEIDAVVTLPDGRWGAVEVKLGAGRAAEGLASLNATIAQIAQIATESSGEPAFRMVVTGTGRALVADDGAVIAPLSALSP